MSFGWIAAGTIVGGIYGMSKGKGQEKLGRQAIKEGNPFGPYRQQYAEQLGALMKDPSGFLNNPLYKAAFGQGQQAVARQFAGKGYIGSGNFAAGLQGAGMAFGWGALQDQERFLAELAGAQFPANPGPGLAAWGAGADRSQAGFDNIIGGATDILSGGATFSDRRLKRNIRRIGTHRLGFGLYEWDFVWGEAASGVMADEVEKILPEAVGVAGGFKTVNYAMLEQL
jgi:hypothetical protein